MFVNADAPSGKNSNQGKKLNFLYFYPAPPPVILVKYGKPLNDFVRIQDWSLFERIYGFVKYAIINCVSPG